MSRQNEQDVVLHQTEIETLIDERIAGYDTDISIIAGLTPANDDLIQRKSGVWVNRSLAQLKTDLGVDVLSDWSSGSAYTVGTQVIRRNAVFACIQAHTNHDPFVDCATALAGSYWKFVALRGGLTNYITTAEQITSLTRVLAPTPDELTVFCPSGMVRFNFMGQYKLSGTSITSCGAAVEIDDTPLGKETTNSSVDVLGTASLSSGSLFYGWMSTNGVALGDAGFLTGTPLAAGSDALIPTLPRAAAASTTPVTFFAAVGVHKIGVKYLAGNGTTVVNVRERMLYVEGL